MFRRSLRITVAFQSLLSDRAQTPWASVGKALLAQFYWHFINNATPTSMRSLLTLVFNCLFVVAYGQTTVTMVNYNFQPAKITATPGTKVTWVNKSDMQHTSTSGTGCSGD